MQLLNKMLTTIFNFRHPTLKNELSDVLRANFTSDITPIKMSFKVHESKETDHKIPPVVIMHGLFGMKQNFRWVGKTLQKTTRRKIYVVDARNHGDSPHVATHSSAHMSADLIYLMQQENIKRISVIGHSMGGRTMMHFTLKYPKLVEKAIIVDISPISIPRTLDVMLDIFSAMQKIKAPKNVSLGEGRRIVKQQIKHAVGNNENIDFILLNLKKLPSGEFVWSTNVSALSRNFKQFRATQYLQNMMPFTGPILFIAGTKSDFFKNDDWPKIKEMFPNAELKWLETGHLVHFDKPEQFVTLVTDFLKS